MVDPVELASEQEHFNNAAECRERSRHTLQTAADNAIHGGAASGLQKSTAAMLKAFRGPSEAVAFGRMTPVEETAETFYIGYQNIDSDRRDTLVMNWQADAAAPYYRATIGDAEGLASKREYSCRENAILSWSDTVFEHLQADVTELIARASGEPTITDSLLDALDGGRGQEMQDIVRTIQAAQYELLRSPLDQLLVIQGGPGTGKTAVALHRVSWILFNHQDQLSPKDLLVVGPSKTFLRYIRDILPGLGDIEVDHQSIESLAPQVSVSEAEETGTRRLKGDLKMKDLIDRNLKHRVRVPHDPITFGKGRREIILTRDSIEAIVNPLLRRPYAEGRDAFRRELETRVSEGSLNLADHADDLARTIDRVWPSLTAPAMVRELLGSKERLLAAAGDAFSAQDVNRLYRQSAERISEQPWSSADLPLLDYANWRITGDRSRYQHVVVDEVQDLSPMELDMLARRSVRGSMTILGDLAQSTGASARDAWDDVVEVLAQELPVVIESLEFGYRVPRQLFEFAAQLLPHIAPQIDPPRPVRDGPSNPNLVQTTADDLPSQVVSAASGYAGKGKFVGVICPDSLWDSVTQAMTDEGVKWSDAGAHGLSQSINVVGPVAAKGLEFDAIVVVEPEEIAKSDSQGLRLLYIALTRATQEATVVGVGSLMPLPLTDDSDSPTSRSDTTDPDDRHDSALEATNEAPRESSDFEADSSAQVTSPIGSPDPSSSANRPSLVEAVAADLAQQVMDAVNPQHWDAVVSIIAKRLGGDETVNEVEG